MPPSHCPPPWPHSAVLAAGEAVSCELTPLGSNYTFLVCLANPEGEQIKAIYKPRQGEAPLWDFPTGTLYLREVASYRLAEAIGWRFIPETIVRDGPYGTGSMQRYIEHDPANHYFSLRDNYADQLRRVCLFDLLANNADRKAGHTLLDADGHIWGIDHGLTFHPHPKLRTVIWDFAGEPIPERLLEDLRGLQASMEQGAAALQSVMELLAPVEAETLERRLAALLELQAFPTPGAGTRMPWPPL